MIKSNRFLLAASFACLLPLNAFSEAPVVDDSENFAMLMINRPTSGLLPEGKSGLMITTKKPR